MSYRVLSAWPWAGREFGGIQLGDERLNRRVLEVAAAMARDPAGSIPKQSRNWKKTKGAYRLFDHPRATFAAMCQSHWQQSRDDCALMDSSDSSSSSRAAVVLMIQDTTWLDYSHHPHNQGMGWHGPGVGNGSGLLLHSVLAVEPQGGQEQIRARIIGLTCGKLWARTGEAKNRTAASRSAQRRSCDRESLRWSQAVEEIGAPPPASNARWLHVGDRESDLFDLYEQTQRWPGVGFVIRVSKDRNATMATTHRIPARLQRVDRLI